jgi:hypothetical protein
MTSYSKWLEWLNASGGNVSQHTLEIGSLISECCKRNKKNPGWALWLALQPLFD